MFPKVHSFLKQCLQDLNFMKTRPFSPNLSKLVELTSAEEHCFHKLKKHYFKNESIFKTNFFENELYAKSENVNTQGLWDSFSILTAWECPFVADLSCSQFSKNSCQGKLVCVIKCNHAGWLFAIGIQMLKKPFNIASGF